MGMLVSDAPLDPLKQANTENVETDMSKNAQIWFLAEKVKDHAGPKKKWQPAFENIVCQQARVVCIVYFHESPTCLVQTEINLRRIGAPQR